MLKIFIRRIDNKATYLFLYVIAFISYITVSMILFFTFGKWIGILLSLIYVFSAHAVLTEIINYFIDLERIAKLSKYVCDELKEIDKNYLKKG